MTSAGEIFVMVRKHPGIRGQSWLCLLGRVSRRWKGLWRSLKRKGKLNIVEAKKQAVIISFSKPCWENAVAG